MLLSTHQRIWALRPPTTLGLPPVAQSPQQGTTATVISVTEVHSDRSYDDLPESQVATALEVPLLWAPPGEGVSRARSGPGPNGNRIGRRPAGRHRLERRAHAAPPTSWTSHPIVHTTRVGLVSAALVLGVFTGILLALSMWLP